MTCPNDTESVAVTATMRAGLPVGQYVLSLQTFAVGVLGEGAFAFAQPQMEYTGFNLAIARSTVGQRLDLINIMTADVVKISTSGFD
eukprot:gene13480-13605_t